MASYLAQPMEQLSAELLSKILALAASEHDPSQWPQWNRVTPHILPYSVGPLILVCKRFAEAVNTPAFWQECWVAPEMMSLYDPRHAPWISRLAVDLTRLEAAVEPDRGLPPVPGHTCLYQPLLGQLKQLQITSANLPAVDLRGLTQLEDLYLGSDDSERAVWASLPAQLLRLEVCAGELHQATWRSLSKCTHLLQLQCKVVELPVVPAEAFPWLQKLRLFVHDAESVAWAASLASRSKEACLRLHADPAPLTQPRFHGLQLEELDIDGHKCTVDIWENMRIRSLIVRWFEGERISRELLPAGVVSCIIAALHPAPALSLDLSDHGSLQEFRLLTGTEVRLELHGSFVESIENSKMRYVEWLAPDR